MKTRMIYALSLILITACIGSAQTVAPCGGAQRSLSISWLQGNFDPCLTGNNPYETKLSPATVGNLAFYWSLLASGVLSPPAVVNGVVYSYNNTGKVEARNAVNGSLLWQSPVAASSYYFYLASPAVANGIVYVGDGAGVLWALKASDGTLLWKYTTNSQHTFAPTISSGVVYVTESFSTPAYTYALDATTGSLLWKYLTANTRGVQPAVNGNRVYVGGDYQLDALDAKTGTMIWQSTQVGIPAAVSVYNGRVYVADTLVTSIHAVNAATGQVLWTTQSGVANIIVANNTVYTQDGSGGFWALDAYTGAVLWQVPPTGTGPATGMAIANGVIYGNIAYNLHDSRVLALDAATGATLWSYEFGSMASVSGPAVVNGVLYSPMASNLVVFHLASQ
jgi:outer membrane protein assembly factor BamB